MDNHRLRGDIDVITEHLDGTIEKLYWANTILKTGRTAIANVLANNFADTFDFYINRMIFGINGTVDGVPKFVDEGRQGLFGLTVLSKPVIATVDPNVPTQAVFTSVITFSEVNSLALSEMALQMANGDLYSMKTFPDLSKTSSLQLTINWRINVL